MSGIDQSSGRGRDWIVGVALFGATVLIYLPVILHGGFIWDDPQHITNNLMLRDLNGLGSIWIHPSSIPQYYPLAHSTFWVEYQLWGARAIGYHVDNVLLHALSAVFLWRVLRRLDIPAAGLAAAFFAVHPVQVESVAWATERKNVLSAAFYLLSLHAYLNWAGNDLAARSARMGQYFLSLGLFVAALLSKSIACSLPAAILLLVYWRWGRVRWRDVWPLVPFFVLGLGMACATGFIERSQVGASGVEWGWSFGDRCLIAGRALWFYAGKLVWPQPLVFIYPKWRGMSFSERPWMIGYPAAALAVIGALWGLRWRIGRGPLVAVLFFAGTLLPALGFINIYTMRFSFVADHFQYLASIGLFVLLAAALKPAWVVGVLSLAICAGLSIEQQGMYRNALTLWQKTAEENPGSWMVQSNLADQYDALASNQDLSPENRSEMAAKGADGHRLALELGPGEGILHWKWGLVEESRGQMETAREEFLKALAIDPQAAPALDSMGALLLQNHDVPKATDYFRRAVMANPKYPPGRFHYGQQLEKSGDIDGAIEQYTAGVKLWPENGNLQFALANQLLASKGRADLAIGHYAAAVEAQPVRADFRVGYAAALRAMGRVEEARNQCVIALRIDPSFQAAEDLLGTMQRK